MKVCKNWLMCFLIITALSTVGIVHAQTVPDLNSWVGKWFKTPLIRNVFHFNDIGVPPTPLKAYQTIFPAYCKIISWNSGTQVLQGNLYVEDTNGRFDNPTRFTQVDLYYFAGTDLNFVCVGEVDKTTQRTGFTILFKGVKDKSGNFKLGGYTYLKTLGAYHLELDSDLGTERWAGTANLAGNMIPPSKVPLEILP